MGLISLTMQRAVQFEPIRGSECDIASRRGGRGAYIPIQHFDHSSLHPRQAVECCTTRPIHRKRHHGWHVRGVGWRVNAQTFVNVPDLR